MSQEEDRDPLHIGNTVAIVSEAHGLTIGRVIYSDDSMVRLLSQEASDRAIEFPMAEDKNGFAPELGVASIEVIEAQESDKYVDTLGARPGDVLEFFTADGAKAAETGEVTDVNADTDTIRLKDGRVLEFQEIGPMLPIAVIRVVTAMNAPAALAEGVPAGQEDDAAAAVKRQQEILALLASVQESPEEAPVGAANRSYPDAMQREDMFQGLREELTEKKRSNPRRIRAIEREVDIIMALRNKSIRRDAAGNILGPTASSPVTIKEAVSAGTALPAAIPVVAAALNLNLDIVEVEGTSYKATDVNPRVHGRIEADSEVLAAVYTEQALPATVTASTAASAQATLSRGFFPYVQDLLTRDLSTLSPSTGADPSEWTSVTWAEDQDVIRTAGLGAPVQGLSKSLPKRDDWKEAPASLAFLVSDVTNRSIRVLAADNWTNVRTGLEVELAPADPGSLNGYVILPTKAALSLRPPKQPGDLPTALLYSAALQDENLPTVAQALRDLYSPDAGSPQNAWMATADLTIAEWLQTVLRFAVHPSESLAPRTPSLLSVLDTLGLGSCDLSPPVSAVIQRWISKSQKTWRRLLDENRKAIQTFLDAEPPRTFQTVTGTDSPLWPALQAAESLKDLLADVTRRNPAIVEAPTVLTSAFTLEAQGDAAPLVWSTISVLDARASTIDPVAAAAALSASRSYTLRRKALRDIALLRLSATPEINTCIHVERLEGVRNVTDDLQQSRLLRDFVEEFQGGRNGDWMTCVLCKKDCVCYHELMALEAAAQPGRQEAINKQILIKFGGERYLGKICCRNCGQAIRDIDYDDSVGFDDNGNAVVESSVLTDEQLADITETTWKQDIEALAPPAITFATPSQQALGAILHLILERGGMVSPPDVVRQIVRYADLYVSVRSPSQEAYEKQRTTLLAAASTRIKKATGTAVASVDVPTYANVVDQLRVVSLTAFTVIFLQIADPPITVNTPYPLCTFSREGWPLNPEDENKADGPDSSASALKYVCCVVASIQKDIPAWQYLTWSGDQTLDSRRKKVMKAALSALQVILVGDPKAGPLSFTPEIRMALGKAREDVGARKARALVSRQDVLPPGFRPEPSPPTVAAPALDADPVPALEAALAAGQPLGPLIDPIQDASRRQTLSIIGTLHAASLADVEAMPQVPSLEGGSCCPVSLQDAAAGVLRGPAVNPRLQKAQQMLTGVGKGTKLWPLFETPYTAPVEQIVDESTLFKLFLNYCYTGPQVGRVHEFSHGNVCRQCNLALGKPFDLIDIEKEGAGILAAQQGPLRLEITRAAFDALSNAVRRNKFVVVPPAFERQEWRAGLQEFTRFLRTRDEFTGIASTLVAILAALPPADAPMEDLERAALWTSLSVIKDGLQAEVGDRIGPLVPKKSGRIAETRAREAVATITQFELLTADPFLDGPRGLQEYFCAKALAAASQFQITSVNGARWFKLSEVHNERINRILSENSTWFNGVMDKNMFPILQRMATSLGPVLERWIELVRPGTAGGPWTIEEGQLVLRSLVLQAWRYAVVPGSGFYQGVLPSAVHAATAAAVADWTNALLIHVKRQFARYSKEKVKQILQERAGLERDSIVEELGGIKDDDERAAALAQKNLGIGRWARGKNIKTLDADTVAFEIEQRHRMGIIDAPVEPILLEGAPRPGQSRFGFGALDDGAAEEGYDMGDQAAADEN
jgi:hypothetical protein